MDKETSDSACDAKLWSLLPHDAGSQMRQVGREFAGGGCVDVLMVDAAFGEERALLISIESAGCDPDALLRRPSQSSFEVIPPRAALLDR